MLVALLNLLRDGGPWMIPVAVVGMVGVALAVVNAFTRRSIAGWVKGLLVLCLIVGMVGASFGMFRALDYIAAGPEGQKFWMPLTIAALGVLPPYMAAILAAVGSGLLGVSCAYCSRHQRRLAVTQLIDGTIGCSMLVCFATLTHIVPKMLMAAAASEDKHAAMALGLASSVQHLIWPASLALIALTIRGALSAGQLLQKSRPAAPQQ